MRNFFVLILWGCLTTSPFFLFGQNWVPSRELPVILPSGPLQNPWAGGLNSAQFVPFRLDFDAQQDLLVFDRTGQQIQTYRGINSEGSLVYQHEPAWEKLFPPAQNWLGGFDVSQDGDMDLFTLSGSGILFYRNEQSLSGNLEFSPTGGVLLQSSEGGVKSALLINPEDIPALTDVDLDGDMDILVFDGAGVRVVYHQNQSQELYQHSDSLIFTLVESCWGQFTEDGTTNAVNLNVFCKTNEGRLATGGLHAGSTLLAWDADGDQDKDLWLGDISFGNMVFLENGGSPAFAQMSSQSSTFPDGTGVSLPTFPAAFRLDVDQDNAHDLLLSPHATNQIEDTESVWWYRNLGTDTAPQYSLQQTDWLQETMLDVGTFARPILFDYNQDGKLDLILGNQHRYDQGQKRAQLALFLNIGTNDSAAFSLITDDWGGLRGANYQNGAFPGMGDLDGDGDADLIVGKADGTLDYFENISSSPIDLQPFLVLKQANLSAIDVGDFALPFLWDWDGDSLLDLVIGEQAGNLNYYRNSGTHQQPAFSLVTDSLLGVSVLDPSEGLGFSTPFLHTHQDTTFLWIGSLTGPLLVYQSTDSFQSHIQVDSLPLPQAGRMLAPAVGSLTQTGPFQLLLGNQAGGIRLFEQGTSLSVSIPDLTKEDGSFYLIPNPTTGKLSIKGSLPEGRKTTLSLFTLEAKKVASYHFFSGQTVLSLSHLTPGMYLAKVETEGFPPFYQKIQLISP